MSETLISGKIGLFKNKKTRQKGKRSTKCAFPRKRALRNRKERLLIRGWSTAERPSTLTPFHQRHWWEEVISRATVWENSAHPQPSSWIRTVSAPRSDCGGCRCLRDCIPPPVIILSSTFFICLFGLHVYKRWVKFCWHLTVGDGEASALTFMK